MTIFLNDVPLGIILKKLKIINFSLVVSKGSRNNNGIKKNKGIIFWNKFFVLLSLCKPTFQLQPHNTTIHFNC